MDILDIILTAFYALLSLVIGMYIRSQHKGELVYDKYFMPGLIAKLIGGVGFALVYTYYYTYGGDTMAYFHDGSVLVDTLLSSPLEYFTVIWASPESLVQYHYDVLSLMKFPASGSEWFTVKITSVLAFIGLNNYYSTTMVFAMFSYFGIWRLFLVMARRYPQVHRALAFSLLFVPSVFFWGSGIMKDCIVIGFLGWLIYCADIFTRRGTWDKAKSLILAAFCAYIILNVKAYVVVSLVPAVLLWIVLSQREKVESQFIRAVIFPALIVISLAGVLLSVQLLGQFNSKYSIEQVMSTAEGVQSWHYVEGHNTSAENGRGSSYSLGDYEPTLGGLLVMFLPSVNVTLFRPYLWEVKNVAMLAAAIESTIIFLFSLFIFLGLGFFRVIRLLFQDSFLFMAVAFSIFFAFAVGFSTYNFGALARYKIPCMPFYLSALFILRYKVKQLKVAKVESRVRRQYKKKEPLIVNAD